MTHALSTGTHEMIKLKNTQPIGEIDETPKDALRAGYVRGSVTDRHQIVEKERSNDK